jgi:hypothetical protein
MGDRGRPRPADRSVRHSCELTVREDAILGDVRCRERGAVRSEGHVMTAPMRCPRRQIPPGCATVTGRGRERHYSAVLWSAALAQSEPRGSAA